MESVIAKRETREWMIFENEGKKIFGVIHHPYLENPPLVIIVHGFASSKVGTHRSWVYLAESLAKGGIAALRFDFRGAGDSEGSLSEMDLEGYISDAYAALCEVKNRGFRQIGFFGSSLGGAIAVLTAGRHGGVDSLALWAPVASGELWVQDFLKKNSSMDCGDLGAILTNYRGVKLHPRFKEQFGKMFAFEEMKKLSAVPLLHFQGENDTTVSTLHQKAYQKSRDKASAPSRFISYPDIDHILGFEPILQEVIKETVQWFQKTL